MIAIAGGGIIGLSIAWRLAQRGYQVTVFDKGPLGAEASWAGAGMLAPGGEVDGPSELASLAIEARALYQAFVRELTEESGFAIDFQECGALDLAYSAEERETLEVRAERQAGLGIASKPVPVSTLPVFWPGVQTQGLTSARFYPGDAIVNPREVVLALCAACRKRGVLFEQDCAVTEVGLGEDGVSFAARGKPVNFDALVIAAGAWSDSISVHGITLPAAEPVKGHLIGYQQPDRTCSTIIRRGHTYLLQRASGLLIVGSSVERIGFNRDIDPAIVRQLASQAGAILPHLAETAPSESWIGFRPGSSQLRTGRWHSHRLYLAYGHYRNGILLAPATARGVAAEITANLQKR